MFERGENSFNGDDRREEILEQGNISDEDGAETRDGKTGLSRGDSQGRNTPMRLEFKPTVDQLSALIPLIGGDGYGRNLNDDIEDLRGDDNGHDSDVNNA
ncbi:unnamed protein product [Sphenostylis stenocarpa]|uniref:Uncharacterized protein n=1 Tax=Sphenostylis stenocarpa TaxID=92480 RepID=A0AA86RU28_9FABA|nr:unnamed protein product [Sphenostylis stenocarpa]